MLFSILPVKTKKKKVQIAGKVQEIRMQRDLFGRLLGISLEQNIDITKVLSYPLTPVPMSLCHLDGTICKTDKSILMKYLEAKLESQAPTSNDVMLLDGFFILHLIKEVPHTFGKISTKILQIVTNFGSNLVDIIFDRYFSPSIKNYERDLRNNTDIPYNISGPDQSRPHDFTKELRNNYFKEALVKFLIEDWASDEKAPFIGDKIIRLNFDLCYRFVSSGNQVKRTIDDDFTCEDHEKADTKIIFHLSKINFDANVLIRCNDTDVLVIILGNMENFLCKFNIWMEVGTGNHQRHIDITKLYTTLGASLSSALPGFHAITGCDYNPAFFRKGKSKPLKLLEKSLEFQTALTSLKNVDSNSRENVFDELEKFVCRIYNIRNIDTINEARFELFCKTYKFKNLNESFKPKLKNYDASSLPPCKSELFQQLLRAQYITSIWGNAHMKYPTALRPQGNGWIENNGKYEFVWFEGNQLPTFINDIVIQPSDDNNEEGELVMREFFSSREKNQ